MRTSRCLAFVVSALGICLFTGTSAHADLPGFAGMNDIVNMARRDQMRNQEALTGRPGINPAPAPLPQQPTVPAQNLLPLEATDFQGSGERIILSQVSSTPGFTLEQREEMRRFYRTTLDGFEQVARKNNLAAAYTYLFRVSLEITAGVPMPDQMAVQLLLNLNKVLGDSPEFRAMDARQRQLTYETAITTAGSMTALFQANDVASKMQARQAAAAILAQHGVR